ncbi:hypothetical protein AQI88_35440 [Streptomyces cellostaticus]|uniref:Uncharacterized protein n=1 Tax=Streptomyces cellostaticus TaxID=67285 RepID=A0A101NEL9_9ACTN|nr:hypothetical protein AQI88_35440 [Streptomyces cellostaticus]
MPLPQPAAAHAMGQLIHGEASAGGTAQIDTGVGHVDLDEPVQQAVGVIASTASRTTITRRE